MRPCRTPDMYGFNSDHLEMRQIENEDSDKRNKYFL